MAEKTVRLSPDDENEGVTVSEDGRVYIGRKLAGETVNVFVEIDEDVAELEGTS